METPRMTPAPNGRETKWGLGWLAINLLVLPLVLTELNALLPTPLSSGLLNTVYYCLNFAAVVFLFRDFLKASADAAAQRPFPVLWYAILGYLGYQTLTRLLTAAILTVAPDFGNVNDASIYEMLGKDLIPLALCTVFLVPVAEETLYRGLIFRSLFDKNPTAAYIVSMVAFAAIHVTGYVGSYPPLTLVLCFLQYLPAGYCLCWCYRRTGTILCPILMHAMVNGGSILAYLR